MGKDTNNDEDVGAAAAEAATSKGRTPKKRKRKTIDAANKDTNNDEDVGAAGAASDDDDDDEDYEDITVDKDLLKPDAVRALEADPEYQTLRKLSAKSRREQGKHTSYRDLRQPIRSAASAARDAYIRAARAQPDTPDVRNMLKVIPIHDHVSSPGKYCHASPPGNYTR